MILEGYKGKIPDNQIDALRKAYASNERQLGIINDLLRVAQLDAGKVVLSLKPVDLVPVMGKIISDIESRLRGKNQRVVFHAPKSGTTIPIDLDRMLMAFENIIDNASKYSPDDTTITIEIKPRKYELDVTITDEGIGIRKRDLPKLFQKFSRLEDPSMNDVSGNGLGLYWANKIIELHKGKLTIESKPKKGSTFIVTLPKKEKPNEK
jgi:two-component system phosphate regulon sensor histidine kinase PhoR